MNASSMQQADCQLKHPLVFLQWKLGLEDDSASSIVPYFCSCPLMRLEFNALRTTHSPVPFDAR